MKRLIILMILILHAQLTVAQTQVIVYSDGSNEYSVITDSLNVRSCPSTQCNVISTLKKGEIIKGRIANDSWLEININGNYGYLYTKYIEEISADNSHKESTTPWILYIIIAIIVAVIVLWVLFGGRCPECKKSHAIRRINRECVDEEDTTITKVFKTTNSKGQVIRRTERPIPATRYYFTDTYECKYCGYSYEKDTSETREN